MTYPEYLNHKSILDCESERDLERHHNDVMKILECLDEKVPYGAILQIEYSDPGHCEKHPEYMYAKPGEYIDVLSALDTKNGVDFRIFDGDFHADVYGSNYTFVEGNTVLMIEADVTYHFLNEEKGKSFEFWYEIMSDPSFVSNDNALLGKVFQNTDFLMDTGELLDSLRKIKAHDALFLENIIEISMIAGNYMQEGKFKNKFGDIDSRAVNNKILALAAEFEEKFSGTDWDAADKDYLETIIEFAKDRLLRDFGLEPETGIKAILVELDYKGVYERFALTPEEFKKEYPQLIDAGIWPISQANTFTLSPMVDIHYNPVIVGDETWNTFFTDMEWGLPESDIEIGNLVYIREDFMQSLKEYLPQVQEEKEYPAGYDLQFLDAECKEKLKELYTLALEVDQMSPMEYHDAETNLMFSYVNELKQSMDKVIDGLNAPEKALSLEEQIKQAEASKAVRNEELGERNKNEPEL